MFCIEFFSLLTSNNSEMGKLIHIETNLIYLPYLLFSIQWLLPSKQKEKKTCLLKFSNGFHVSIIFKWQIFVLPSKSKFIVKAISTIFGFTHRNDHLHLSGHFFSLSLSRICGWKTTFRKQVSVCVCMCLAMVSNVKIHWMKEEKNSCWHDIN